MNGCRDLTVEEIVADPIVRALMRADRVDPVAFELLLRSVATGSLASREQMTNSRPRGRSGPAASAFKTD